MNTDIKKLVIVAGLAVMATASATYACTRCCKWLQATTLCPVVEGELRTSSALEVA